MGSNRSHRDRDAEGPEIGKALATAPAALSTSGHRPRQAGGESFAMTGAIDYDDTEAEGDRAQRSALPVEGATGRQGVRQTTPADCQRSDAERDVDGEQIRPGSDRQNGSRDRWPDRGGDGDHHCVYADTTPEQVAWVDVSDQSHVDTHDPCRAKSLQDARQSQQKQRMRKPAKQRCYREEQ